MGSIMKTNFCVLGAMLLVLGTVPTEAATFTATAEGNTITIYSTSDKEEICSLLVPFSYWYEGKREYTSTRCPDRSIIVSEKSEVCNASHELIVNPKIEGPVQSECR
mgnify:CR=1 FL=1